MKKIKFRFFLDYEKEEKWVNEMAAQGWHLRRNIISFFVFEQGEPGKYIYRNELVVGEKKDYCEFLESLNIECISKFGVWAYYRKEAADGAFELYSDAPSKIKYLKSISRLFIPMAILSILIGFFNIFTGLTASPVAFMSINLGFLNVFLGLLMYVPIRKIQKRKKHLELDLHIFEG
ncbi:DUF2812 domain-containing protein [Lysinibacillus sp. CD3-6]|uniref:DUF2812 domain-containing protein n=1 Tax=Lysinibacillus sp. CD3-6 TaxID=2892541 RepID=UPI001168C765|nr:DUF2812 domain-containing protein [Lysinibacillus sp. CD3-6]UED82132.1 DUF2812 domain-containing protein [Lysinibacillus sp. CD3-6]